MPQTRAVQKPPRRLEPLMVRALAYAALYRRGERIDLMMSHHGSSPTCALSRRLVQAWSGGPCVGNDRVCEIARAQRNTGDDGKRRSEVELERTDYSLGRQRFATAILRP